MYSERYQKMWSVGLALLICLLLWAPLAGADPIPGLFNTGLTGGGANQVSLGADANYTLASAPATACSGGPCGPTPVVVSITDPPVAGQNVQGVSPIPGFWVVNGSAGGGTWINPTGNTTPNPNGYPTGTYTYQLQFNFNTAVLQLSTAILGGTWASDNNSQMFLNGNLISSIPFPPGNPPVGPLSFDHFTAFSSGGGGANFVAGLNTLQFVVQNFDTFQGNTAPSPTGLIVNLSGTADAVPPPPPPPPDIPEPATALLLGSGLAGLALMRWLRKSA